MEVFLILGALGWSVLFLTHWKGINNRGGGSKPQVVQTPSTPAPSASESAESVYQARLKYDPLVAQQEMDIQRQMLPQQTALYQSLYNQYYPDIARQQKALQQEFYPQQAQLLEAGAGRALERMRSPDYMTPEEQLAQQALRDRAVSDLQQAMRERSNLGGTLYGGRSAASEARSVGDLLNQFQVQDYQNRMTNAMNAQEMARPYLSILYPEIGTTQPQYSPYQYQSAVPSPDSLYSAMYQASRPNYLYQQGSPSPMWGLAGSVLGGLSGGFGAGMANKFL